MYICVMKLVAYSVQGQTIMYIGEGSVFILVVVLSRFQDIHVVMGNLVRNGLCCR